MGKCLLRLPGKVLSLVLMTWCLSTQAADYDNLVIGAPVTDINIGQFSIKLPEGKWTVAAKLEARAGSQGGSSGTPSQLWVSFARVDASAITGLLTIRTPASTFIGVSRWNDDPCRGVENALAFDTMKQTFAMPECFTVTRYGAENITRATSGYSAELARWLKESGVTIPDKMWRVYYSKYRGGDFLHLYAYLPIASESHAAAEAWGRAAAAALQSMVIRDSARAVLPPLP